MLTSTSTKNITLSIENPLKDPTVLEPLLYEAGMQIACIARREMQWGKFRSPFSSSMRMGARGPATRLGFGSRIRISHLTSDSVTVSMPREVLGRVAMRLPEIEEYLTAMLIGR